MSKFIAAIKRTLTYDHVEPPVHFHQGTTDHFPEVCHDGTCRRPQLAA